jgi:hypothetical protein
MIKKILQLCFTICFIYLWYQGFVLFLKFAWTSKYFIVDDPALWAVLFVALYFLEHPKHK